MSFSAKILADSLSPDGVSLTTFTKFYFDSLGFGWPS